MKRRTKKHMIMTATFLMAALAAYEHGMIYVPIALCICVIVCTGMELHRSLKERMKRRIMEQIELQRALGEARRIAGGENADRKRNREKTAR